MPETSGYLQMPYRSGMLINIYIFHTQDIELKKKISRGHESVSADSWTGKVLQLSVD